MFAAFFLLWMLFNGKWTAELAVAGLLLSAVFYAAVCRLTGSGLLFDLRLVRKLPALLELFVVVLVEIFRANVQVILWIYRSRETAIHPEIVHFHSGLRTAAARAALVCCITLTPGTIVADLEEDTFVVHCLDHSLAEGLDQSGFIRCLKKLEGCHELR